MTSNIEARIKVDEGSSFHIFTAQHPDCRINYWCNEVSCVMLVESKDVEDIEDFERELGFCSKNIKKARQGARLEIMYELNTPKKESINEIITRSDCWYLQPVVLERGWEHFTVYALKKSDIERLVRAAKEKGIKIELLSIREKEINDLCNGSLIPASSLHQDITKRQLDLLRLAYDEGYFDQPARITADELAAKVGLSRSTLAEHLRKAEYRLLRNALPAMLVTKSP
ncbi:MAG: helix-turn-helix domain-containing protein [Methanomassiliicoccales archaeon]|nr:MAG: helix-turn-helix domain-containing protein [Methanomassiliicoccales archaeon]